MSHVLAVNQLDVTLDNQSILNNISFSLSRGEILGLVGPSGCGKTTLLNTIAGFIAQQSGEIIIDGTSIDATNLLAPEKRHVGMIFQDYALFPHLTVRQNIAFGLKSLTKEQRIIRVDDLLALLKLEDYSERFPHQLSGGQQQRVAIARAIAPQPKLLLLDEPFSNIDARLRQALMLELRQLLKSLDMTAIFVTHNKDEVFTFADKMAVMSAGTILQFGSPSMLCQQPNSYQVADFLQLGSWLPCKVVEGQLITCISQFEISLPLERSQSSALLVKPQHLSIEANTNSKLCVSNISVTEQGFHYLLTSENDQDDLAIHQLSVYSEQVFTLGDKVAVEIKPHDYLIFATP
ncbi:ABC transporter ATP-binding protein [Thalassotalea sp. M1531]|uniref:ABC transporter ATP-binding protein n=1 Tax=Thalassotalea algicola TaxID=2716224 RepID=A0A7Y0LCQ5_9GAMM|nr:ABC transporter ATP-binding protein [Thalassotalea algicola]NMP32036.1 ABC transporter ATP-binding protein [Thalassotalea algicola]